MDPFTGLLLVAGMIAAGRGAWVAARSSYRRAEAQRVAEAETSKAPGKLTPSMRRAVIRRHRAGWIASEVRHGFPVTRTGMHAGWLAHQAAAVQTQVMRERERTSHLEVQASFLAVLADHRRRQEAAREEIAKAVAAAGHPVPPTREGVREAAGATVSPLFPRRDQPTAGPQRGPHPQIPPVGPAARPRCGACGHPGTEANPLVITASGHRVHESHTCDPDSAFYEPGHPGPAPDSRPGRRDSDHLRPGEPRCEACGGSGGNGTDSVDARDACPACRGWGGAAPDPFSLRTASPGSACAACGRRGTDADPVVRMPGGRLNHRSHAIEAHRRYREALAELDGSAIDDAVVGADQGFPDCTLCGEPLRLRAHDGMNHVDCEEVTAADDSQTEIIDDRPLEEVEADLLRRGLCSYQISPGGWDHQPAYCGRAVAESGANGCDEHLAQFAGDDDAAADARAARVKALLAARNFMPAPTSGPQRCATIGHGDRPATHEITYTHPGDQASGPVTERVCAECAASYPDRPALRATAREITAPPAEGEASPMTADTTFASVLTATKAAVARSEDAAATLAREAAAAYALADEMTAAGVDAAVIDEQMSTAAALDRACKELAAAGEHATGTHELTHRYHGGVQEAVDSSPGAVATREFHSG